MKIFLFLLINQKKLQIKIPLNLVTMSFISLKFLKNTIFGNKYVLLKRRLFVD